MDMDTVWLMVLAGSLTAICFILLKIKLRWLGYTLINIALAAVILYAVNLTGILGEYTIPLNIVTVATIGILGLPGAGLLLAIKLVFI